MIGRGQLAREHDVPVEDRAHRVGDRLVHVVAVDQHGIEPGDRAASPTSPRVRAASAAARTPTACSRASSSARRSPSPTSRCAIAKRVTLSIMSITSRPGVAEVLRDPRRDERRLDAHERRLIAGRNDHHRTAQARFAQIALDEVAHFFAALADQRDHVDVGGRVARDHAQDRRLADAAAGEDADALAFAARQQPVDRAHAQRQRFGRRGGASARRAACR